MYAGLAYTAKLGVDTPGSADSVHVISGLGTTPAKFYVRPFTAGVRDTSVLRPETAGRIAPEY